MKTFCLILGHDKVKMLTFFNSIHIHINQSFQTWKQSLGFPSCIS